MNAGAIGLAVRHMRRHAGRTLILVVCVATVLTLPLGSRALIARFDAALTARASETPLVIGAKGSRFDLVFAALYLRVTEPGETPMRLYEELLEGGIEAIPLHVRFTARGRPVAGASFEYFERRGLRVARGRWFAMPGEAVLGAEAARALGVDVGDTLASDQRRSFDVTVAPSILMPVVGVLEAGDGPDDGAVFVDLETAWLLEGAAHAHAPAEEVEREDLVIGRAGRHTALSGAMAPAQKITPEVAATLHVHGERARLPLTALLVYPADERALTILRARINETTPYQAVVPERVVEELMAFVARARGVLDAVAALIGVTTALLLALVGLLSYRVREAEVRTLREIGAPGGAIATLFGAELAGVLLAGGALAALASAGVALFADTLVAAVL